MKRGNLRIFFKSLEKRLQYTYPSTATGLELFRTVAVAGFPLWKINCYTALSSFSDPLKRTSYVTNNMSFFMSSYETISQERMYLHLEHWDMHSLNTLGKYIGTRGLSQLCEEVLAGEIGKVVLVKLVCKYIHELLKTS